MSATESEGIIRIINAVKKRECLWNVNSSDYAKRDKLERAWKEVAQEVGKSDVLCRDKWRNVRTGFLRSIQHEIRNNQDEPSTEPPISDFKRKRFYLYDHMAFLLPSAETLEKTRKKRKLSKNRRYIVETDDGPSNDGYSSSLPEYNLVGKFESHENNEDDDIEVEHHTLLINGDPYTVHSDGDDNGDINIEEILKEMENNVSNKNIKRLKNSRNEKSKSSSSTENDGHVADHHINVNHSSTTKNVIHMIGEQINGECSKSIENLSTSAKSLQFSQRAEQQLLYFFHSCVDDIIILNKQKQRLFKKRMLDLIDELHGS